MVQRVHPLNKKLILFICGSLTILLLLIINNSMWKSTFDAPIQPSDYRHLINISFTFKTLPLVCSENKNSLLILVHSATDHFNNRKVIRETWGQYDEDIKVLFLMGLEEDNTVRTEKLEEEIKHYGDIVQGNFLDTYHNLTYKHVMGLKYVVYHCPVAKFIFKVDDDVFVNVPILKQFIISYVYENGRPTKIFCSRFHHNPVLRSGKWATSVEDFPANYYPDHCSGFAILYPKELIFPLYTVAQKSKFFWVDDVFVSGICAQKLNISHIGIENLVLSNTDILKIVDLSFTNVTTHFLIGRMNLSENEIRSLWKFVISSIHEKLLKYLTYD